MWQISPPQNPSNLRPVKHLVAVGRSSEWREPSQFRESEFETVLPGQRLAPLSLGRRVEARGLRPNCGRTQPMSHGLCTRHTSHEEAKSWSYMVRTFPQNPTVLNFSPLVPTFSSMTLHPHAHCPCRSIQSGGAGKLGAQLASVHRECRVCFMFIFAPSGMGGRLHVGA